MFQMNRLYLFTCQLIVTACLLLLLAGSSSHGFFSVANAQTVQAAPAASSPSTPSLLANDVSDAIWSEPIQTPTAAQSDRMIIPQKYRAVTLNVNALQQLLQTTTQRATVVFSLPLPDGTMGRFRILESPNMAPELAAKFSKIKTYAGQGLDDPTATVQFDWTPAGFHAMILSATDTVLIDPYSRNDTVNYISYYKRDYQRSVVTAAAMASGFQCPSADQAGFPLGVSNTAIDPIFCSYPAVEGEDPYDFYCTYSATTGVLVQDNDASLCPANAIGSPPAQEIAVEGNNVVIANGDNSPSLGDHTDFDTAASGSPVARTFTIRNTGGANLTVGTVTIGGAHASDFSVTAQPASPVAGGGSTTFQITFTPSAAGVRTATISIPNNDSDENPYAFAIQGTGAAIINSSVTQISVSTSNNPTPQSCAATGTNLALYTVTPTLQNSSANTFADLFFRVKTLEYTANQGGQVPSLCNATTVVNNGGVGSILAVANSSLQGGDNQFNPGDNLIQAFQVGRPVAAQFRIKVDLFSTTTTAADATGQSAFEEYLGSFEFVIDPTPEESVPESQLFLPLVSR